MMKKAVVLLSGGLDSATCLAIARSQGFECYCLSFDYGQRHRAELVAAERVAKALGAAEHRVINFGLAQFGGSALTDTNIAVPTAASARHPGHLCAGAQHHHAVAGAGLGRSAG
jgi:7-cyano-7-deazaguanine synthase